MRSIFLISLSILLPVAFAVRCFDSSGNANSDYIPCNASATVSSCCAATEYCLDNGLCLNAIGNNLMSTKGCTDANWGAPCKKFCPGSGLGDSLFPCPNTFGPYGSNVLYCCGEPNASACCSSGSNAFQVPVGKVVLRPIDISSPAATPSTTPTDATASMGSMSTSSPTSSTSSTTASTTSLAASSVPESGPDSKSLAIGLGVGIPLGLAFIGGIIFLGVELHKYNRYRGIDASRGDALHANEYMSGYPARPKSPQPRQNRREVRNSVHELSL